MKAADLEVLVCDAIDRAMRGENVEGTTIELKSDWPASYSKAARQLAGLANAARGEPVTLVIGVDEKAGSVTGADQQEIANWWGQVKSYFEFEFAPDLLVTLSLPIREKTVVALHFHTDRAPYLVKNPCQPRGPVEFEVPWREGNSTRTARRADMLRLLVPIERLPEIELLSMRVTLIINHQAPHWSTDGMTVPPQGYGWAMMARLYIHPRRASRLMIPSHRCELTLDTESTAGSVVFDETCFKQDLGCPIYPTTAGALIEGPGIVSLSGSRVFPGLPPRPHNPKALTMHIRLPVAEADYRPAVIDCRLDRLQEEDGVRVYWQWNKGSGSGPHGAAPL